MTIAFTFMILHNLLKDKECHHHLFVSLISLCRHFEPTISPIDHTVLYVSLAIVLGMLKNIHLSRSLCE